MISNIASHNLTYANLNEKINKLPEQKSSGGIFALSSPVGFGLLVALGLATTCFVAVNANAGAGIISKSIGSTINKMICLVSCRIWNPKSYQAVCPEFCNRF